MKNIKKYYVVYRIVSVDEDGRNECITPVTVIENEEICKDFCKKHCCQYYEEIIEDEN